MSIELYTEDRLVYQFYPITSNQLTFKVKAPNDAHIILTSTPYESQPCYEVFFGGWGNTKSIIRKNQQKPDVCEVATPQILNASTYKSFWIRWDYNTITAGIQGNPNPILRYQDQQVLQIQFFGVCTGWGASGHWIIDNTPVPGYGQVPFQPGYGAPQPGIYPSVPIGNPQPVVYPTAPMVPPQYSNLGFGMPTTAPRWVSSAWGNVPPNAIVAGNDVNGEPIYVVRARHEGALIPGKLVSSHKAAYVAWGGRENPKNEYEVLCDCNPRWIPTSGSRIPAGAFISGQTETGEPLYVGRAFHNGSMMSGKVQSSHGVCYIPFGGEEIAKSEFEILTL